MIRRVILFYGSSHLVAGGTARLKLLCVVTLTVELILVDAVGQVDELLGAGGALETGRMPGHVLAKFWRHHTERSGRNVPVTAVTFLHKSMY